MKEIPLSKGKVALVDDEDFERLSRFKWYTHNTGKRFYAARKPKNGIIYMHREIIGTIPEGMDIDHIDGIWFNNQKKNLRVVTRRQNLQNKHVGHSSQFVGVTWRKDHKKWAAQINRGGKKVHIGYFSIEQDAFTAYTEAVAREKDI